MPAHKAQILLVEDNEDDILLMHRALRRDTIVSDIVVKRDGEAALSYLQGLDREDLPQLVLLDINLPKLSGHEVLKRLRADERTRFLPVVMLTTSDRGRDVIESYAEGANSYVRKPIDFGDFQEAVRELGVYWLLRNVQAGMD